MTDARTFSRSADGLHVVIDVTASGDVRLLHLGAQPLDQRWLQGEAWRAELRLVEVQATGFDWRAHHGNKYVGTSPARLLTFRELRESRTALGVKWEVVQAHAGIQVISHLQFVDGVPALRAWSEVVNDGAAPFTLEYVSSLILPAITKEGLGKPEDKLRLQVPHNTWHGETQWQEFRLSELGLRPVIGKSIRKIPFTSQGTWSSAGLVPMAVAENRETGTAISFQIEHNGSWHWEISDHLDNQCYIAVSGPTEREGLWWQTLVAGERFTSVPVGVAVAEGAMQEALQQLTRYRRRIRRPNDDNRALPVIFNDYMNCLFGEPTTAKLAPLIDAAAEAGCEYFCIDCGWYSDGSWWDGVGEWMPSTQRFPGGIEEPLARIRAKGMVPGLWLELEVMGTACALAATVPDDWFFLRHGRRVIDHGRYQLDYRNPAVRAHADAVIDRLVGRYGVGYIKMDYNINGGPGTEHASESIGAGLLGHNRAYLAWLDAVFARHPTLVIENCGSGGLRLDYALLARHSVQSTTDQCDYRKMAAIAGSVVSACAPEQAATWAYPLRDGDLEEVVFNMVNALTMRIHQSGHLAELSPERLASVKEALAAYKGYRHIIPEALPIWPLGMPQMEHDWLAFGLKHPSRTILAVWRLGGGDQRTIPLPHLRGRAATARVIYPATSDATVQWHAAAGNLAVRLPNRTTARLVEIVPEA
ncbi:MAG TPA: glycoside hydrolase family 36 protein [Planctomycetota bacterium]|nr:glycoside hydrolase family 36 protein [Planctomycetota bacterium]